MIVDGERIKHLLKDAKREVVLCAPFIKKQVIEALFSVIPGHVSINIYTRWHPAEVALGVSDLEVFDVVKKRPNTSLFLSDKLHAKLYMADENCLVGSANLTASALGWSKSPNLELLLNADRNNQNIMSLFYELDHAVPATYQLQQSVFKEAKELKKPMLIDAYSTLMGSDEEITVPWLPHCAAPSKLFDVYKDPETTIAVEATKEDAKLDLIQLSPPINLDAVSFVGYIKSTLVNIPSFNSILENVPGRLTDNQGIDIIKTLRPEMPASDATKQWQITREWIKEFFSDQFEVAPESFVVRLKGH